MREFSTLKQRILEYLELKGITRYEFYSATGISNGILSQKNGLSEENLLKFLKIYHDVNFHWFLTGTGEIIDKDTDNPRKSGKAMSIQPHHLIKQGNRNELNMICKLAMKNALLEKENKELKNLLKYRSIATK
ncbi:MAG TPA: hypothetical protein PK500_01025 [Candidatus Egerieousia sp.]|nr:hypothetical protein [Candidatus Egerieousia sp.]HPT05221.1 hypothetical protein [Candidatus Egerieousia sp.]